MLNIRINVTIDVKKWAAALATFALVIGHMITPAQAVAPEVCKFKTSFDAIPATVHLTYLNVTTTKQQAADAITSPYAKYFDPEALAFLTVYAKGQTLQEWKCLDTLWNHESHFNPKALNMGSKAYGIAQFLPTTWGNYKLTKTSSAALQIKYGLHYIKARYGDACSAWAFWQKHSWY